MVVLGLSVLDDGRHRHHRFLLLHHLARLPARSTFTRHREPIYFADLFTDTLARARARCTPPPPPPPPWHRHQPRIPRPFRSFFFFRRYPRPVRTASSREKKVLPFPHLFCPCPPSLELKHSFLLVSIWYGCTLHFFGVPFVIDRASDCLIILWQKVKSVTAFREQEGV